MKKVKAYSKPPFRSSRFAVWWVDCGAFLFSPGANCGEFTPPNRPSPVCCKPNPDMIAKESSKKGWPCFYHGVKTIKSFCRAIAGRVWQKCKTKNAAEKSHEQGFSMLALCLILPLLVILVSIFIWLSFWLKNFWGAQKICEELTLEAQHQMRPLVSQILDLNPEIIKLRKLRTALRIKLAAAVAHGNAPLAATLKAQLKLIDARLMALYIQQNLIFEQARNIRLKTMSRFRAETTSLGHQSSQLIFYYAKSLGLTPDQMTETPPIYQIPTDFTEKQSLELQWTQKLYQEKTSLMKRACRSSLDNKRKWRPRLLKARASSSY